MSSNEQIEANRQNALLGGVKTEAGKAVSRTNAIKFGFFSRLVTEFDKINQQEFCEAIYDCFEPQNAYESQLIEILLSNLLTYRRIALVEHELTKEHLNPTIVRHQLVNRPVLTTVEKEGYKAEIKTDIAEGLEKCSRYKVTAVNLMIKIHHELERLSRMRKGEILPAPIANDVNISISTP